MTSKALRKQLLAAVAMVLVAAIAVSSSTFAWFAGNNVVTAQNMRVQAVAEGGIEIKHSSQTLDTDWSTINASGDTAVMKLFPTSTENAATWVHASAEKASSFKAAAGSYSVPALSAGNTSNPLYGEDPSTGAKQLASQFYDGDGKQYYRVDTFNIRTVKGTTSAQKVVVKEITVSGTPAALDQSLRVLVKHGTTWYNYNAGGGSATRNVATAVTTGNPSTVASVTYRNLAPTTTDSSLATSYVSELLCTCAAGTASTAGAAENVDIYIYYEGEDANHFTNNLTAAALAQLNVTVSFAVFDSATAFAGASTAAAYDYGTSGPINT